MSRIIDILRAIFISPEFAILLIIYAVMQYKPEWLTLVGTQFQTNNEIWKFLPTLPLLFTSLVFKYGKSIRVPLEKNKRLYEWNDYHRITDRVFVGIFISVFCSIGAISIWFLTENTSAINLGAIFIATVGISGFSAFTMYLASISIREVLDVTDDQL
ncbi:hypothetical protein [Acidithiobacillus marinus]|uniref:hypothetical protein n=1 Tax=Acidithiobacillus marinus TaxID=187490 RepID=UPI00117A58F6|nr:hypothetical protein [Acidithiobacillus marinus]